MKADPFELRGLIMRLRCMLMIHVSWAIELLGRQCASWFLLLSVMAAILCVVRILLN